MDAMACTTIYRGDIDDDRDQVSLLLRFGCLPLQGRVLATLFVVLEIPSENTVIR